MGDSEYTKDKFESTESDLRYTEDDLIKTESNGTEDTETSLEETEEDAKDMTDKNTEGDDEEKIKNDTLENSDTSLKVINPDITGMDSFQGAVSINHPEAKYTFTAPVSGTYRFDTDRSAGGEVKIQLNGENENCIVSGNNGLSVDLEAGKTYTLAMVYYNGSCEYTVSIGMPNEVQDISDQVVVDGSIKYRNQSDEYIYTAPVSGTYRFDTDRSAGGEVRIEVDGVNGNNINSGKNGMTIDLEMNKTYKLAICYLNGNSDYTLNIGVPNEVKDIFRESPMPGSITYKDQVDYYRFTADASHEYQFEAITNTEGKVKIIVYGENGNQISSCINELKTYMEYGKNYIIAVNHNDEFCDYTLNISYADEQSLHN